MQVSFIIPLFNCLALTRAMLTSLQDTLPGDLTHEIILVDDGSTDGTREWLATLTAPFRVILNERNLGYAAANNAGAAAAHGEILFFLNNDLVLSKGWFQPMYNRVRRKFRTGLVGNVQVQATTGELDHCGVRFNRKGKPEHLKKMPRWSRLLRFKETIAVTGACFCISRELWRQLGGFEPAYINGCEDIDLCLRARAAGRINTICLHSIVGHHISQSPGRKLRDEHNSRRLLRSWREEIVMQMARLVAREWSANFIATLWDQSCLFDYALARHALGSWLGIIPTPPPPTVKWAQDAVAAEFTRWEKLLGPED